MPYNYRNLNFFVISLLTYALGCLVRVFENRVLRKIFGSKRDGVKWHWRKLHTEEPNDLYCSPNIVLMIKSIRMR
jgi:hypothetical protein